MNTITKVLNNRQSEYSIKINMAESYSLATPQIGRISMDIFLGSGEKCPIDLNEE